MKIKVVILGNRKTCTYCKNFWGAKPAEKLAQIQAKLNNCDVIDADAIDNPKALAKYRPSTGCAIPTARIFDAKGKAIGQFLARSMSVSTFTKKVLSLCPDCVLDGEPTGPVEPVYETCPTCGGTGKVLKK